MNTKIINVTIACMLVIVFPGREMNAAETVFQFGPSGELVDQIGDYQDTEGEKMDWSKKRLFSDKYPLTPVGVSPEVFGGFEVYDKEGFRNVFITLDKSGAGKVVTGVNNNTFNENELDALGLLAGHLEDEGSGKISYKIGFLVMGELEDGAVSDHMATISIRLSNRQIDQPTILRPVIQIRSKLYISSYQETLGTTSDQTIEIKARDLRKSDWYEYDPDKTLKPEDQDFVEIPDGAKIKMAGILVERPVVTSKMYGYFVATQIAELKVEAQLQ